MKFQIKNRWTGNVQFECELSAEAEAGSEGLKIGFVVKAAIAGDADLRGADLRDADLRGADLRGAYLGCADLGGAYLGGADLRGADLRGAYLGGANLGCTNLRGAYLGCADLRGADLGGAYLGGADLRGADLRGAYLRDERLTKAPLSLLNLRWDVLITGQFMVIGCQRHTHERWAEFDDRTINTMDTGALKFWRKWKGPLMALCEAHHEEPEAEVSPQKEADSEEIAQ